MGSKRDDPEDLDQRASVFIAVLERTRSHSARTAKGLICLCEPTGLRRESRLFTPFGSVQSPHVPEQRFPDPSLVTTRATAAAAAVSRLHDHKSRTTARCRVQSLEAIENRIVHSQKADHGPIRPQPRRAAVILRRAAAGPAGILVCVARSSRPKRSQSIGEV